MHEFSSAIVGIGRVRMKLKAEWDIVFNKAEPPANDILKVRYERINRLKLTYSRRNKSAEILTID